MKNRFYRLPLLTLTALRYLLIVFIAIAVGFVFGCIMGYVVRDEMLEGISRNSAGSKKEKTTNE